MKLYIKQKVFSFKDKFQIWDENGDPKYYAEGEIFSLGKKLHIYDMTGNEVIYIHQKLMSFLPTFYFSIKGSTPVEVKKNFTFFSHKYTVPEYGMTVEGDFLAHDYSVTRNGQQIAYLSKQWFTFGDAYEIYIAEHEDELSVLGVILIIDCCMAQSDNN